MARILRNRLHWGLHSSTIRPGDRLPSVRELGVEFGVDTRTVLRAAQLLVDEGLVELRSRSGIYVSTSTMSPPSGDAIEQPLVDILMTALDRGIPPSHLPARLDEAFLRKHVRVACVDSNADHANAICAEVVSTFAVEAWPATLDEITDPGTANPLATADAAISTAFHAAEVRAAASRFGRPVFVATMDAGMGAEVMRQLRNRDDRPVYIVGTDRRWAERATAAFEGTPHASNLRLVVLGADDACDIPDGAEIFVTPAVAPLLHTLPFGPRARVLRYKLGPSDARGLIRLIVAAPPPPS